MGLLRYIIYAVALVGFAVCGRAEAFGGPLVFPGSEAAQVAVLITDASGERVIADYNSQMALMPASILKCITSATALTAMAPDSVPFVTDVTITGDVDNTGCLHGGLAVKGCADPTLGSNHFHNYGGFVSDIVAALRARGVNRIAGTVEVDRPQGYFGPGRSWEVEDIGEDYGGGLYGFNWRDNIFSFIPAAGTVKTVQGDVECVLVTGAESNSVIRGVDSHVVTVYRRSGAGIPDKVTTTMWDPAGCFLSELADSLDASGIVVGGRKQNVPARGEVLLSHRSPSNIEILRSLMTRSDNLMAEGMLRVSAPVGSSLDSALSWQKRMWIRLAGAPEYAAVVDGSGLSRKNRLSPRFFNTVLAYMLRSDVAKDYVGIFPRCGREGTVARFLRGTSLQGRAALKSGSMGGVLCYAGYVTAPDGVTVRNIVVVMVNGFFCPMWQVRKAIEKYLLKVLR